MGMITLKEYALRHGKDISSARYKALRGTFQTARKIGRDWFIDEDEPYEDKRIKTGAYIGFKYGYQYQKQRRLAKEQMQDGGTHNGNDHVERIRE